MTYRMSINKHENQDTQNSLHFLKIKMYKKFLFRFEICIRGRQSGMCWQWFKQKPLMGFCRKSMIG